MTSTNGVTSIGARTSGSATYLTTNESSRVYYAGDHVLLYGVVWEESYGYKGSVEYHYILRLSEPIDAYFGAYPNESEQVLHEGVNSVELRGDPSTFRKLAQSGELVLFSGVLSSSSKQSGGHYEPDGSSEGAYVRSGGVDFIVDS